MAIQSQTGYASTSWVYSRETGEFWYDHDGAFLSDAALLDAHVEDGRWVSAPAESTLMMPVSFGGFGLDIPSDAPLRGLEVGYRVRTDTPIRTTPTHLVSRAVIEDYAIIGAFANQDSGIYDAPMFGWLTVGGPEDTWGDNLTHARLDDALFKVAATFRFPSFDGGNMDLDAVRVTVWYGEPDEEESPAISRMSLGIGVLI